MDRKNKKIVHPSHTKQQKTEAEQETEKQETEKLMGQSIKAYNKQRPTIESLDNILQFYAAQRENNTEYGGSSSRSSTPQSAEGLQLRHPQFFRRHTLPTFTFGDYELQTCSDQSKKFRPLTGLKLTDKQQCLLDNLWHIQTLPPAARFKVQILNALSVYFAEQSNSVPEKKYVKQRFTHYVILRGTKTGIFHKWETVAKYTNCPNPMYKGYSSFAEALEAARQYFGIEGFFIEPEEVQTYAEKTKTDNLELIKSQEKLIIELQEQLVQQKDNTVSITEKIENNILKRKVSILEEKIGQLIQKLEKRKEDTVLHRNFEAFRARIIDTPWQQCMKPVTDYFPEITQIISQKICTEFPLEIYELQQRLVKIAFGEEVYTGVNIVERTKEEERKTGLLLVQIKFPTDMPDDFIVKLYHYGMIDYMEGRIKQNVEKLFDRFGEKFIIVAGNIGTHIFPPDIICKFFSSLPEASESTYRPARKRVFISHRMHHSRYLKTLAVTTDIDFPNLQWLNNDTATTDSIAEYQETPEVPFMFRWENYKLVAEGHYIQIWCHHNWNLLLPFVGEGDRLQLEHIRNEEDRSEEIHEDEGSPQSIDSTHRDF